MSEWSYATYLTHFPTLLVLLAVWKADAGSWGELAARAVVWLAVALGLAALVYRHFERPLTDLRPSLAPSSRARATAKPKAR